MQYEVMLNEKNRTFTIKDMGDKPNPKAYTQIWAGEIGEVPDAASHPEPGEHLKNQARNLGLDYKTFTVKNDTKNEFLDRLEQEGEEPADENADAQVITSSEDELKNLTERERQARNIVNEEARKTS